MLHSSFFTLHFKLFLPYKHIDGRAGQRPVLTQLILQETLIRLLHILRKVGIEHEGGNLRVRHLTDILDLDESFEAAGTSLEGKTFVITGSLEHYVNRRDLKADIEAEGGKVAGSVSANTDYLITNNPESGSAKNRSARELGVSIITEEEIMDMLGK